MSESANALKRTFPLARVTLSSHSTPGVAECSQNHGGVTMPVPIVSGRLHEPFDLALGEVLASAIFGIWQPTTRNCSLYSAWSAGARS
jgi:hypothetical protein